jgi:hypothetical protein
VLGLGAPALRLQHHPLLDVYASSSSGGPGPPGAHLTAPAPAAHVGAGGCGGAGGDRMAKVREKNRNAQRRFRWAARWGQAGAGCS